MAEAFAHQLSGRQLGEFVLREHIGEGGFGMVFRADQPILDREAVVKVSQISATTDGGAVEKFLGEARLASRLDHPFAAHVYAFGAEPDGLLWIAMELVRGTPLDALLARQGPLPLERAIPFLRRLCEVVHTAHEQGIVHRDLKPANVMVVSRAGSVFPKLLDLGIATEIATTGAAGTGAGGVLAGTAVAKTGPSRSGTPFYMAPEQWVDARRAGPPADIYALGALTYEVLTGGPPFTGRSVLEIAALHARRPPPTLPAAFPPALSTAIGKAMAKRAAERWPTALAFGDALRETSGIALETINLPQLDDATRDDAIVHAPQPIAEAVAAVDAARAPAPALEALWRAAKVCAHYVGALAIACRARGGPGRLGESPAVVDALSTLRTAGLDAAGWWRLARELARPFAAIPEAHPMPELIGIFFEGSAELRTAMDALLASAANAPSMSAPAETIRDFLVGAVPALVAVLRALRALDAYRLAVPTDDGAGYEEWVGVRRPVRPPAAIAAPPADATAPILVGAGGAVVASLGLVAEAAPPAPGAPAELFWIDGPGRQGARMIALPSRLERHRADGWDRLGLAGGTTITGETAEDVTPYRGLMTFTESDAELFFGREREVEAFVNRLRSMPLIAVVGPSGAGKSSFVRAGVLPTLGASWSALVVRPGPTPLLALCARLATIDVAITPDAIRADPDALGSRLRARARADGASLLVVVDQFEELFTLCLDHVEQDAYAEALVRAARTADESVRVVVTLRDDFLVRAAQLAALRDRLASSLQILTTPVADDLLRILIEPARRAGYAFEDDQLPREMVAAVENQPAALALLSFTAHQLWQFRDRQYKQLPRKQYRVLGGVGGALAQHAEATLDAMTEVERGVVREIFRHLVTADGTRAVLSRTELLQVSGDDAAGPVLERLITARLLVAMESAAGGESIEVVHEALLSAWPRLVRWRQEDAEGARLRDQVRVAARQWAERGRPRGLLWRGEALTEYRLWRARYPGALTEVEDAFGAASLADAARGRRVRRIALGTVLVGLTVALVVFARLRTAAEASRARAVTSEAEVSRRLTESFVEQGRRALIAGDTTGAALYLDAAYQRGATGAALQFMIARALDPLDAEIATLRGHTGQVGDVGFAPGGDRLFTASDDGTIRLWDRTGAALATIAAHPAGAAVDAAWSPDGTLIVSGGADGIVKLWDAATHAPVAELKGHQAPVNAVAFDPTGARILSSAIDGSVIVWSVATRALERTVRAPSQGTAARARFSPDGTRIAIAITDGAGGGSAEVWPVTGPRIAVLAGHTAGVWYAVFDPSGTRVVTASLDHSARIFDAATGATIRVLRGHDNRVTDVAWSPDGALVVTASADDTIKVWDAGTGEVVAGLRGHTAQVNRLAFTADGTVLISAAADGTARLWDPHRGTLLATYSHGGFVFAVDVSGDTVATASWLGTGKLWRLGTRGLVRTLAGAPGPPAAPLVSGLRLMRPTGDGVEVWDPTRGTVHAIAAGGPLIGADATSGMTAVALATGTTIKLVDALTDAVRATIATGLPDLAAIAVAPDGRAVAAAAGEGTVVAWDAAGTERGRRAATGPVQGLTWSPDGARIVAIIARDDGPVAVVLDAATLAERAALPDFALQPTFQPDGARFATLWASAVTIWNRDGAQVAKLEHAAGVTAFAWSPAGDRAYVGQIDGSVQVWSSLDWSRVGVIRAHDLYVPSLAVSGDGALLVSAGGDGLVKVFSTQSLAEIYEIRVPAGTQWAQLDPTAAFLMTSDGATVDLWAGGRSTLSPAALHDLITARVPFELAGTSIVPRK